MALVTPWPSIRQALLQDLRSNLVLKGEMKGGWSEGFAPQPPKYPLGLISLHYAPSLYDWSGRTVIVGVDVFVVSKDQGEASSLYQLAFTTLQDAKLDFDVTGLTSLQCRQVSDLSLPDVDAEGKAVYEVGGVWEIRVAQSTPTSAALTFTLDSTIA